MSTVTDCSVVQAMDYEAGFVILLLAEIAVTAIAARKTLTPAMKQRQSDVGEVSHAY